MVIAIHEYLVLLSLRNRRRSKLQYLHTILCLNYRTNNHISKWHLLIPAQTVHNKDKLTFSYLKRR